MRAGNSFHWIESRLRGRSSILIEPGRVVANESLCDEHLRLTIRVPDWPETVPGQFIHLGAHHAVVTRDHLSENEADERAVRTSSLMGQTSAPLLRRAFSVAGLRRDGADADLDVIYRVVGAGTRWMETLHAGDLVSVMGPLGNQFPISRQRAQAWLVAGGVGLPPMLWLAEALAEAGREVTAFCGARSAGLLPLSFQSAENRRSHTLDSDAQRKRHAVAARFEGIDVDANAERATDACVEFARCGARVVISTDDGTLGFHGHVGAAMAAFHRAQGTPASEVVVYTCGPEPMMRFVAEYCVRCGIECYVCMERAMACGTGLCQSCVVPLRDAEAPDGWRYRLCCTDGPVFEARTILWDEPAALQAATCGPRPVSQ